MSYVERVVDLRLDDVLATFPAAMILGPRACGKTTTARRRAGVTVELDDPAQAAAFRADPSAALTAATRRAARTPSPCVLLDEWQDVPDVLGAVKRLVDAGAPAGSFLLTGSVRAALAGTSWAGTGRIIQVEMSPMTVLEQTSTGPPVSETVDALFSGRAADLAVPEPPPNLLGYVDAILGGGYPPVLGLDAAARATWMSSYVEQIVLRDVPELGRSRDTAGLRRLLRAIAENTAGITADVRIAAAVDADVKTVRRNEGIFDDLRLVTSLPAWYTNRISRLVKSRKRYVVDTGLAVNVLGVDGSGILSDGGLLGRLLDTFVLAQLRPLLGPVPVEIHHLRQQDGRHEVDLVLERSDGRICGIEIKAGAAPTPSDGRHLAWLRDEIGDRFASGVVFHTGRSSYVLGERIAACPIAALWG